MKKKLCAAILAVVLSPMLASKVSADEFSRALQGTLNTATQPMRMLGQNLCANAAPGSAMEASWCNGVVVGPHGNIEGYNPNSVRGQYSRGYNNRGYGVQGHRSRAGRILHGIFAPEPYYPYGTRPYGYGGYYGYRGHSDGESIGDCVKDSTNAFRKAKAEFDPAMVMAACTGVLRAMPPQRQANVSPQQPERIVTENTQDPLTVRTYSKEVCVTTDGKQSCTTLTERKATKAELDSIENAFKQFDTPTPATKPTPAPTPKVETKVYTNPTPAPTPTSKAKPPVYVKDGKLCNNSEELASVYVNGKISAKIPAHGFVTITNLPFWHMGANLSYKLGSGN